MPVHNVPVSNPMDPLVRGFGGHGRTITRRRRLHLCDPFVFECALELSSSFVARCPGPSCEQHESNFSLTCSGEAEASRA